MKPAQQSQAGRGLVQQQTEARCRRKFVLIVLRRHEVLLLPVFVFLDQSTRFVEHLLSGKTPRIHVGDPAVENRLRGFVPGGQLILARLDDLHAGLDGPVTSIGLVLVPKDTCLLDQVHAAIVFENLLQVVGQRIESAPCS